MSKHRVGCNCKIRVPHGNKPLYVQYCPLHAAAPELLAACKAAVKLVEAARRYFPKSMHNSDRFQLENTCATLGKAIAEAEGR